MHEISIIKNVPLTRPIRRGWRDSISVSAWPSCEVGDLKREICDAIGCVEIPAAPIRQLLHRKDESRSVRWTPRRCHQEGLRTVSAFVCVMDLLVGLLVVLVLLLVVVEVVVEGTADSFFSSQLMS